MTNKSIQKFLIIVLAAIGWTYWLPLFAAIRTNTLTSDQLERTARNISTFCDLTLARRDALQNSLYNLESRIATAAPGEVPQLLTAHSGIYEQYKSIERRIRIAPFSNSQTCYYFFVSYLLLFVLIKIQDTEDVTCFKKNCSNIHAIIIGVGLFIFFNWSNWLRNSPWGQAGRTLFSYSHLDISPLGFIIQELHVLGMMVLCGYVATNAIRSNATNHLQDPKEPYLIASTTRRRFELWQLQTLVLSIAFLPWTNFYWRIVTMIGESRYFPSAIGIHTIWALLWFLISLSAWRTYQAWNDFTTTASTFLNAEELKSLLNLEPVSKSMFATTAVASTLSFIYPFIKPFLFG